MFIKGYLTEKPGSSSKEYPLNVPGLEADSSLCLRVVKAWEPISEIDEDISAVVLGDKVLCTAPLSEYDNLVEMIENKKYRLGLDKEIKLYLLPEIDIIEEI